MNRMRQTLGQVQPLASRKKYVLCSLGQQLWHLLGDCRKCQMSGPTPGLSESEPVRFPEDYCACLNSERSCFINLVRNG